MAKIVSVMCDVELGKIIGGYNEWKGMSVKNIEELFGNCSRSVSRFDIDENFSEFEFKGKRYVLPERFMEKSTVIEYMEASQFQAYYSQMKEGMWGALPFVIAVLAREEGEAYNDEEVMLRGEMFKELDLNTAMNISFF